MLWCLVFLVTASISHVYIHEKFDEGFEKHWTYSEDKSVTHGVFHVVERKFCDGNKGIKSMNDSSYYHVSSKLDGELDTTKSDLYLDYLVQFEQNIDCGGGYLKLFPQFDQKTLTGNSPYSIMIGPDVCGHGTRTVHLILEHNGKNHQMKDSVSFESDTYPRLISLFIGVDRRFVLKVDGQVKKEGLLKDHFDYLLPEKIDDPEDKKPEDWEDNEMIDDPSDTKPEDWDDRKEVPDPQAKKPDDWDESTDGEWEADLIPNPAYKGDWAPKQINNPKFKGVWAPKQIPNPDYKDDKTFGDYRLKYVGFDLWTVKSGTVFDDVYLSDNKSDAEKHEAEMLEQIKSVIEKLKEEEKSTKKEEVPPEDSKDEGEDSSEESEPQDSFPEEDDDKSQEREDL